MSKKQNMIMMAILSWVGLMVSFGTTIEAESLAGGWRSIAFLHGLGCIVCFLSSAGCLLSKWFDRNI